MDSSMGHDAEGPPVRQIPKGARRVLGVLLEKAFTTPEYYPLTLKACTSGCNQKQNRDPLSQYSEENVEQYLDDLRQLGLIAVVHSESGRTERFRHFMRKRYTFTEPQLAVLTELFLRGRQQMGELRTRASRMVPIESQEDLRTALQGLIDEGYVQATGSLDRRGVEVDHTFYLPEEKKTVEKRTYEEEPPAAPTSSTAVPQRMAPSAPSERVAAPAVALPDSGLVNRLAVLEAQHEELQRQCDEMAKELRSLQGRLDAVGA